jgi:quinoprotein dehydrogenase-associated probable ABC transporter substrate-binding protein
MTITRGIGAAVAAAGLCVAAGLLAFRAVPSGAETAEIVTRTELRVCADPSDLPYSNDKQQGFENKIAAILGQEMKLPVTYVWFPQVIGFVRNTLRAYRCDLVMGTASGDDMMDETAPYYHSGYVIVTRAADHIDDTSLGDPVFAEKHIGVIAGTPPTDLLVQHDLMDHVTSYELSVDTRQGSPPHQMLLDLAAGKLDVALLWGPIAGYYVHHDHLPLKLAFLVPEPGASRLDFHIAMGVRSNEIDWRRQISSAILKREADIRKVLVAYGIPLLDEQNKPISLPGED